MINFYHLCPEIKTLLGWKSFWGCDMGTETNFWFKSERSAYAKR
jgi:hypothetical protein